MRKRRFLLTAGVALLCTAALAAAFKPRHIPARITPELVVPVLRDGDIICRLGNRVWSSWFSDMSPVDKRFSHMGIVCIRDDEITVINAEGRAAQGADFVNETKLTDFLDIALATGVYRAKGVDGSLISRTAASFAGRPFDWKFDMEDEASIYCTELLYAVMRRIAPEIRLATVFQKELGKTIIPPEACTQPEYFTEVLYVRAGR
jgi:hypothetical protein